MACVGEKLEEREAGKTMEVVNAQMEAIGGEIFLCCCVVAHAHQALPSVTHVYRGGQPLTHGRCVLCL